MDSSNPLSHLPKESNASPTCADFDADGDLLNSRLDRNPTTLRIVFFSKTGDQDCLVGTEAGELVYWLNVGSPQSPNFTKSASLNPMSTVSFWGYATPESADLDNDGDLDVIVGDSTGKIRLWNNTGNREVPTYSEMTGALNCFGAIDLGERISPALADFDSDGDQDLMVALSSGELRYWRNTAGPGRRPVMVELTGDANPLSDINAALSTESTAFGSMSFGIHSLECKGFGCLLGFEDGRIRYYKNSGSVYVATFTEIAGSANPMYTINAGMDATGIACADFDEQNGMDCIVANAGGDLIYARDAGTGSRSRFVEIFDASQPMSKVLGSYSSPCVIDIDADGDHDVLVASSSPNILRFWNNTGTAQEARYQEIVGVHFIGVTDASMSPTCADLDGDGDFDCAIGNEQGGIRYFRNDGDSRQPAFVELAGAQNPFHDLDFGLRAAPHCVNLLGEAGGVPICVVGNMEGKLTWLEAVHGDRAHPRYTKRAHPIGLGHTQLNPNDDSHLGSTSPASADLDLDGDLDLLVGVQDGRLRYAVLTTMT